MPNKNNKLRIYDFLERDLAKKYPSTSGKKELGILQKQIEVDLASIQENGYLIIPNLISKDLVENVKAAVTPLLTHLGRNELEGLKTQRVYSLLVKTRACDFLLEHPRVLALLDALFLPNYLLSQFQVINILPGEEAQPLHHDDMFYPVQRPRKAISAATIWAIDDFNEENGSTVVIPKSHTWDERTPKEEESCISTCMPAGSVLFFLGTLWHGGGTNKTNASRLAITAQYCEPWARTQENYSLSMSAALVRGMSEDIKRMIGYSVHPPFMGMVDGKHPKRLLE